MKVTSRASRIGGAAGATVMGVTMWGATLTGAVIIAAAAATPVLAQNRTPSTPGAFEYFESPSEGEHLSSPFTVRAGIHGMGVSPSATAIPKTGHHDLLIDSEPGPLDTPLPATNNVVHLSSGETEAQLTLSPGWHTLRLVFTDGNDMNFNPPLVSKPVRVYVRRH